MPKTLASATVDRLMHHAHVCVTTGDSVRLQQATSGKGVKPLTYAETDRRTAGRQRVIFLLAITAEFCGTITVRVLNDRSTIGFGFRKFRELPELRALLYAGSAQLGASAGLDRCPMSVAPPARIRRARKAWETPGNRRRLHKAVSRG